MKKIYLLTLLLYIIGAGMLVGLFYWVHLQHPNHTTIEIGVFMGLMFPLLPAYAYFDIATTEKEKGER